MKRGVPSSTPRTGRKGKTKVKGKSREKRFDPLEYLNSLIEEVHDHRSSTVRKRGVPTTKRELTSALAHTTPYSQCTAASSKVRSKSSYSQYRKKSSTGRDVLKINLNNFVTEEDNIHFTQMTAKETKQRPHQQVLLVRMTRTTAARKIQRAWRNYQTLKVVRKYYEYFRGLFTRDLQLKEQQSSKRLLEQLTLKRDFQHTLKIRRNGHRHSPNTTLKLINPAFRVLDFERDLSNEKTKEVIRNSYELGQDEINTIQLPNLMETKKREEKYDSKELQVIVNMFRNTQEAASKEIEEQLSAFYNAQAELAISSELSSKIEDRGSFLYQQNSYISSQLEGMSPLIFSEMEAAMRQKFQIYKARVEEKTSKCMMNGEDRRHAMEQLQGRMQRELRAIEGCRQQYLRGNCQLRESMLKMQNDNAVALRTGGISMKVRRSYSADTLIIKSILQEVAFKYIDLDLQRGEEEVPIILERNFQRKNRIQEGLGLTIPTSPPSVIVSNSHDNSNGWSNHSLACYQIGSDRKIREAVLNCSGQSEVIEVFNDKNMQIKEFEDERCQMGEVERELEYESASASEIDVSIEEQSLKQDDNSHLIRECSEQIEEQIQAVLLWELVEDIYKRGRFWLGFKPLVETPYEFRPIRDQEIDNFLNISLPKHYKSDIQLLQRINQKINPTTLQILRLIRDFDFEIDQYQLVLPEEVFKAYRRTIEEQYVLKIKAEQQKEVIEGEGLSVEMARLVNERQGEKRGKKGKFLSFERDLKIMYMKAVFNCYNELIIETKSFFTYMNGRSSIGPGELTLALKEYNSIYNQSEGERVMMAAREKIVDILKGKCFIPYFRSHRDLQLFQKQISVVIRHDLEEAEYKWVNYMDEVLQLWQQLSLWLQGLLLDEVVKEFLAFA